MSSDLYSIEQAKAYIDSIDFSMLIEKMVEDGWLRKEALATAELYRHFLYLNKKYMDGTPLPPSEDIDQFWHYHILDTKKYTADCDAIFGHYLHHYPYLVLDRQMSREDLNQAFNKLQALHIKEFGEPIFAMRSRIMLFWHRIKNLFSSF